MKKQNKTFFLAPVSLFMFTLFYLLFSSIVLASPPKINNAGAVEPVRAENPQEESVKTIEKRIKRLANAAGDSLELADTMHDIAHKELLKDFLNNFNDKIEEIIKLRAKSDTMSANNYRILLNNHFQESRRMFLNELPNEIFTSVDLTDRSTIDLIKSNISECYSYPFEATPDEIRQEILEERLFEILGQIPRANNPPTCFISYAWGHAGHVEWVHNLYKYLSKAGIVAHLDRENNAWTDLSRYMSCIETDDYTIAVGTPELRKKWDDNNGATVNSEISRIATRNIKEPRALLKILLAGEYTDGRGQSGAPKPGSFPPPIGAHISAGADFRHSVAFYRNLFKVINRIFESKQETLPLIAEAEETFNKIAEAVADATPQELAGLKKSN